MARTPRPIADPKRRTRAALRRLRRVFPDARCALDFRDAFELLAATILSAQCTDVRVNQVTPALFAHFPDPEAMAEADLDEVETLIHPTGFFRAKARSLVGMAKALVERHGGEVPRDLESLTALPGVGRKTANVVLGTAFGLASGVVVDTHVKRLSARLGLTEQADPVRIERDLMALLPRRDWVEFSHLLILHGRATCVALRPRCRDCPLDPICPRIGVATRP